MEDTCPYCDTPYGDDRDEDGKPFCDCCEAREERHLADLATAQNNIVELEAELAAAKRDQALLFDLLNERVELVAEIRALKEDRDTIMSVGKMNARRRDEALEKLKKIREMIDDG